MTVATDTQNFALSLGNSGHHSVAGSCTTQPQTSSRQRDFFHTWCGNRKTFQSGLLCFHTFD